MNTVPARFGNALILVCSYRGAAHAQTGTHLSGWLGRFVDFMTFRRLREYVAMWRDFAANPRDAAYMRSLAESVVERCDTVLKVVVDSKLDDAALPHSEVCPTPIARLDLGRSGLEQLPASDSIILVYPDPLGLSWNKLEAALRKQGRNVFVLNGRRRFFALDAEARRALALRRFLAQTRIMELVAGVFVIPIAALLAVRDKLAGRA
jgi:hypothetical protein